MNIQPVQGESPNPFRQCRTISGSLSDGKAPLKESKDMDEISFKFSDEEQKKDDEMLHRNRPLNMEESPARNLKEAGIGDSPEINIDPRQLDEQINKKRVSYSCMHNIYQLENIFNGRDR